MLAWPAGWGHACCTDIPTGTAEEQAAARGRDHRSAHHREPFGTEAHEQALGEHHGHHHHDVGPAAAVPWDHPVFELPRSYECPAWALGHTAPVTVQTPDVVLDFSVAQPVVDLPPAEEPLFVEHRVGYWAHAPPRAERIPLYLQTSVLLI